MAIATATCGTYGGYQAHLRRQKDACDECKRAYAAYMKDFRARRPDVYEREKTANAARYRALWRLSRRYPDDFHALYLEEIGA